MKLLKFFKEYFNNTFKITKLIKNKINKKIQS